MADNYLEKEAPKLNVCFFDIEVDFNKEKGFSEPEDPFNPVTAIALHLGWLEKTICIALKPKAMSQEEAETICNKFEDTFLMEDEAELLNTFLDLIEDADVLSGWNSEGYDISPNPKFFRTTNTPSLLMDRMNVHLLSLVRIHKHLN